MTCDPLSWRPRPTLDPPTVRLRLPSPRRSPESRTPARDRMLRAQYARPARHRVALWLTRRFARATAWEVEVAMRPARRWVANAALRVSEALLGVPAGLTREALAEWNRTGVAAP